jgi:hypothetical protein
MATAGSSISTRIVKDDVGQQVKPWQVIPEIGRGICKYRCHGSNFQRE